MALKQTYGYHFERFWKSYPRKVAKGAASKAFEKLKLSGDDVDELIAHIDERKRFDVQWLEGKFIPHAATFLNQHRWEDEYVRVKTVSHRSHTPIEIPQHEPYSADPDVVRRELDKLRGLVH